MSIYVDNMFMEATVRNGRARHSSRWCHMMTDGPDEELIQFAKRIGLRAAWLQHAGTARAHFDVTEAKRAAAVAAGAVEISWRDVPDLMRARRAGERWSARSARVSERPEDAVNGAEPLPTEL